MHSYKLESAAPEDNLCIYFIRRPDICVFAACVLTYLVSQNHKQMQIFLQEEEKIKPNPACVCDSEKATDRRQSTGRKPAPVTYRPFDSPHPAPLIFLLLLSQPGQRIPSLHQLVNAQLLHRGLLVRHGGRVRRRRAGRPPEAPTFL